MAQPLEKETAPEPIVTDEAMTRARAKVFALAKAQGIKPIQSLDDLKGDFWPEDESIDDFIVTACRWRDEDSPRELPE